MALKSITNDHEQINTMYILINQVWGALTGNLLSKLSVLPQFTITSLRDSPPGISGDTNCLHNHQCHHHHHKTTIILNNVTHRASDGQGQHCQSWRRPCRPGCPPSSWSKSQIRGRGGGGRLDKLAACCWSLGSLLVRYSRISWICATTILDSRFESHISYIYI